MVKSVLPFLSFNGDCSNALDFYVETFGATILEKVTYGEAEMAENDEQKMLIMNSNIKIGDLQLSCADNLEHNTKSSNQITFWLEIDSETSLEEIYRKFEKNMIVLSPKEETFWNSVYAKVQDDFGIVWELNFQK